MKKLLFYILFNLAFVSSNFAQWTVSGSFPRTLPNNPQFAKNHSDTLSGKMFFYKSPKWYVRGVVIAPTMPADSVYFVSGVGTITASYQTVECRWYNTTPNSYWNWTGTAWQNETAIDVVNLLTTVNIWQKKQTFQDSVNFNKGLKSDGIIETKGLNTEGSNSKAAATLNGVEANKDTTVTTDFTLNGKYGTVAFDCNSGTKYCNFPSTTGTVDWVFVIRKDDATLNELIFKTSTGTVFYTLKSKMTVVFKNVNGVFKRIQ